MQMFSGHGVTVAMHAKDKLVSLEIVVAAKAVPKRTASPMGMGDKRVLYTMVTKATPNGIITTECIVNTAREADILSVYDGLGADGYMRTDQNLILGEPIRRLRKRCRCICSCNAAEPRSDYASNQHHLSTVLATNAIVLALPTNDRRRRGDYESGAPVSALCRPPRARLFHI